MAIELKASVPVIDYTEAISQWKESISRQWAISKSRENVPIEISWKDSYIAPTAAYPFSWIRDTKIKTIASPGIPYIIKNSEYSYGQFSFGTNEKIYCSLDGGIQWFEAAIEEKYVIGYYDQNKNLVKFTEYFNSLVIKSTETYSPICQDGAAAVQYEILSNYDTIGVSYGRITDLSSGEEAKMALQYQPDSAIEIQIQKSNGDEIEKLKGATVRYKFSNASEIYSSVANENETTVLIPTSNIFFETEEEYKNYRDKSRYIYIYFFIIQIGYMPLTQQPEDWETNYNNYYLDDQGLEKVSGTEAPVFSSRTYYQKEKLEVKVAEKYIYLERAKGDILASFETTAFGFNNLTEDGTKGIKYSASGGMEFFAGDRNENENIITIWNGFADTAAKRTELTYELLTAEPEDWATNYKNYYIDNEGTKEQITADAAPVFANDKYYRAIIKTLVEGHGNKVFYVDNRGNAFFNGKIEATEGTIGGWTIDEYKLSRVDDGIVYDTGPFKGNNSYTVKASLFSNAYKNGDLLSVKAISKEFFGFFRQESVTSIGNDGTLTFSIDKPIGFGIVRDQYELSVDAMNGIKKEKTRSQLGSDEQWHTTGYSAGILKSSDTEPNEYLEIEDYLFWAKPLDSSTYNCSLDYEGNFHFSNLELQAGKPIGIENLSSFGSAWREIDKEIFKLSPDKTIKNISTGKGNLIAYNLLQVRLPNTGDKSLLITDDDESNYTWLCEDEIYLSFGLLLSSSDGSQAEPEFYIKYTSNASSSNSSRTTQHNNSVIMKFIPRPLVNGKKVSPIQWLAQQRLKSDAEQGQIYTIDISE